MKLFPSVTSVIIYHCNTEVDGCYGDYYSRVEKSQLQSHLHVCLCYTRTDTHTCLTKLHSAILTESIIHKWLKAIWWLLVTWWWYRETLVEEEIILHT